MVETAAYPWLTNDSWRENQITSLALRRLWKSWFMATAFGVAGLVVLIQAPGEIAAGNRWAWIAFVFPLAAVGLLGWASWATLEWRRFGRSILTLDPFPGSLGGDVGGTIDINHPYDAGQTFVLTLACIRTYYSGSGKHRTQYHDVLWDQEGRASVSPSLSGTRLGFRFTPPGDLPESEEESSDYRHWDLRVTAAMKGIDFDRTFRIPVFRTGGQTTEARIDHAVEKLAAEPVPDLPRNLVRLRRNGLGIEIRFPARRYLRAGLGVAIIAAICLAAPIYLWIPLIFSGDGLPSDFGSIDLFDGVALAMMGLTLVLGAALGLWAVFLLGGSALVQATNREISERRYLFGIPIRRRTMDPARVVKAETSVGMRETTMGKSTRYQSLVLTDDRGTKITAVNGIPDSRVFDHLCRMVAETTGI